MRLRRYLLLAVLSALSFAGHAAIGVPKADLWPLWAASNQASVKVIDHAAWQMLLDKYLDSEHPTGINRFAYGAVSTADAQVLQTYIRDLTGRDPRGYNRAEQRAYWINLYNAVTVQLVVENYPVESIRKINGGLFNRGPWGDKIIKIQGEALSLNDIEHRILRPIWQDPRIHYAVNCASISCPNLAGEAYTAANAEALLDAGARDYINSPRGAGIAGDTLTLSKIYDWYAVDFGENQADLMLHLIKYSAGEQAERLKYFAGRLKYAYDWRLNAP